MEKATVEFAYLTIRDAVGMEPLLKTAVIFPDDELGAIQSCTELLLRKMVALICHNMDLDSSQFSFEARTDGSPSQEPTLTHLHYSEGESVDPRVVVPLLAIRIGRFKMQQSDLQPNDPATLWWVTHLLPNYFGFGLFAANATVKASNWSFGETGYSEIKRHSEVSSRVHAYSLALGAWCRGTSEDEWSSALRPDAAEPFSQSLQYLEKTSDSAFHINLKADAKFRAIQAITGDLRNGTPSAKVVSLLQLGDRSDLEAVQMDVEKCLFDRDSAVRATALQAIVELKSISESARDRIVASLSDSAAEVRRAALPACRRHLDVDESLVESVGRLLDERDSGLSYEAVITLVSFGEKADSALPRILKSMKQAMVSCDWELAEILAEGVRNISSDPRAIVAEHFARDAELEEQAISLLDGEIEDEPAL